MKVSAAETHTKIEDDLIQAVHGNLLLGNVDVRFTTNPSEVEANRAKAMRILLGDAAIGVPKLIVMAPQQKTGFIDLDKEGHEDTYPITDGLITTNPDIILSGNPADCEMIAMYGQGEGRPVLGLIHVGRTIAEQNGHGNALEYLEENYGLEPQATRLAFAPSIRAASYKFPNISEQQKEDPGWKRYVHQDDDGMWHVDIHQRVMDEVQNAGVLEDNIYSSSIDVGSDPHYFSHRQEVTSGQVPGRNAVMVKLATS